jgi:hypothetical protein
MAKELFPAALPGIFLVAVQSFDGVILLNANVKKKKLDRFGFYTIHITIYSMYVPKRENTWFNRRSRQRRQYRVSVEYIPSV